MKKQTKNHIRILDSRVSQNFKKLRTQLGITQKEIANAIGVSVQQVQKYETGVNRISSGNLIAIAELLKVNVMKFFS